MYITSFGGNESDEGDGIVQGPALPPGFTLPAPTGSSDGTNTKPSDPWSVLHCSTCFSDGPQTILDSCDFIALCSNGVFNELLSTTRTSYII